jgi:pimeloyl-ACP methyl ester carboxylesterase
MTVRDVAGHRVRAWRFGDGPVVLLVHGWGGSGGQMAAWLEPLEDAGLSVVTFDAPAHGASSGRLASVPLFSAVIADLARHFDAQAAVAHSMGAAALALALGSGLDLDAAVLIAPPRSPAAFVDGFVGALGLSPLVAGAFRQRLEQRYGIALEQLHVPSRVGRVSAPVLVVHDTGDREVPWSDGAAIAEACPGARLVTTSGLGHRRILREPGVVRQGVEFVRARVVPEPRARIVPAVGVVGRRHG